MHCPDCDYELREGLRECPRCEYRRAVPPASAVPEAAPAAAQTAQPAVTSRAKPVKWAGALLGGVVLVGAGAGLVPRPPTPEAQVRALFTASESPCRHGQADVCMENMKKIRALDDQPDASLLLADLKVADYLRTQSDGQRLSLRWQQDQIPHTELTAMGNVAYRKGLRVYRSLWISADIKREGVTVPELIFGGAKLPSPSN